MNGWGCNYLYIYLYVKRGFKYLRSLIQVVRVEEVAVGAVSTTHLTIIRVPATIEATTEIITDATSF